MCPLCANCSTWPLHQICDYTRIACEFPSLIVLCLSFCLYFVCSFYCTSFSTFIWTMNVGNKGHYTRTVFWFISVLVLVCTFVCVFSVKTFRLFVFLCLTLFEPWLILCLCCVVLILFCQQKRQTKEKKKNITWSAPSFNFLSLDLFDHPGTVFYAVFMSFWGEIS